MPLQTPRAAGWEAGGKHGVEVLTPLEELTHTLSPTAPRTSMLESNWAVLHAQDLSAAFQGQRERLQTGAQC